MPAPPGRGPVPVEFPYDPIEDHGRLTTRYAGNKKCPRRSNNSSPLGVFIPDTTVSSASTVVSKTEKEGVEVEKPSSDLGATHLPRKKNWYGQSGISHG